MAGRNWTRKSIEELIDWYLRSRGGGSFSGGKFVVENGRNKQTLGSNLSPSHCLAYEKFTPNFSLVSIPTNQQSYNPVRSFAGGEIYNSPVYQPSVEISVYKFAAQYANTSSSAWRLKSDLMAFGFFNYPEYFSASGYSGRHEVGTILVIWGDTAYRIINAKENNNPMYLMLKGVNTTITDEENVQHTLYATYSVFSNCATIATKIDNYFLDLQQTDPHSGPTHIYLFVNETSTYKMSNADIIANFGVAQVVDLDYNNM